jgi:hypothetical protein
MGADNGFCRLIGHGFSSSRIRVTSSKGSRGKLMQLSKNGGRRVTEEKVCDHAWFMECKPATYKFLCHHCGEEAERPLLSIQPNSFLDPGLPYKCDKHGAIPRTLVVEGKLYKAFCPHCVVELLEEHGQPLVDRCIPH